MVYAELMPIVVDMAASKFSRTRTVLTTSYDTHARVRHKYEAIK